MFLYSLKLKAWILKTVELWNYVISKRPSYISQISIQYTSKLNFHVLKWFLWHKSYQDFTVSFCKTSVVALWNKFVACTRLMKIRKYERIFTCPNNFSNSFTRRSIPTYQRSLELRVAVFGKSEKSWLCCQTKIQAAQELTVARFIVRASTCCKAS